MRKRLLVAVFSATAIAGASAGAAFAGEVTGSGANEGQNQGKSWCSFSGLNDNPNAPLEPTGPNNPDGPGGKSQSYGQDVKLGFADPVGDKFVHPGTFCNPNETPLPPQPNRDK
jgi:hypothetical protein